MLWNIGRKILPIAFDPQDPLTVNHSWSLDTYGLGLERKRDLRDQGVMMASTKIHNDAISFDVPTNGCPAVYRIVRTHLIYFGPSFLS